MPNPIIAVCLLFGATCGLRAPRAAGQQPLTVDKSLATNAAPSECNSVEALVKQADDLRARQELSAARQALAKYSQALSCWQARRQPREEARVLRGIGEIHYQFSQYSQARDSYQQALEKSTANSDAAGQAEALAALARIYIFLPDFSKSLSVSEQALLIARQVNRADLEARVLSTIGFAYYWKAATAKSLDYLNRALALAQQINDRLTEAQVQLYLGYLRNDNGELTEALNSYRRAMLLLQGTNNPLDESRTQAAIGGIFTAIGEPQSALNYNQQALKMQEATGDLLGQAITFNNIGYAYKTLGELERALESYNKALACFEQLENSAGQAQTNLFVGNMYRLLGKAKLAGFHYQKGYVLSKQIQLKALEGLALNNIGLLTQSQGKTREAVLNYDQALSLYRQIGNQRGEVVALNNLGYARDVLGEEPKALESLTQALQIVKATKEHELEVLLRFNLARVERSLGKLDDARTHVEGAIQMIESLRIKLDRHELRTSYFASVRQFYDLDIDILMDLHKRDPNAGWDTVALNVSERSRARSLLELLKEAGADVQQGVDPALLTRKALLEKELETKGQQRLKFDATKYQQENNKLERQISDLTREFEEVEGSIRAASPGYHKLAQPIPLDTKQIQAQLSSDTLLLEYSLGDTRSFVWVVGTNSCVSFELPGQAKIEAAAQHLYQLATARNLRVKGETPSQVMQRIAKSDVEYEGAAAALSEMIIQPVAPLIENKRLAIVAEGALQQTAFATLLLPSLPNNAAPGARQQVRTLLDEHELVMLPSFSVLAMLRQEFGKRPAPPGIVAVVADPVFNADDVPTRIAEIQRRSSPPSNAGANANITSTRNSSAKRGSRAQIAAATSAYPEAVTRALRDLDMDQNGARIPRLESSRQEADTIYSLAPNGRALKVLDFDASRDAMTSGALSNYQIIHIATHGLIDNEHPELSGLLLSMFDVRGKNISGFLQLHEIYNLRLSADMVVLSACQTAVGKQIKGEGLIALTRGFMYGGASRVVASLWKVDDVATAKLMADFYEEMFKNGLRPPAALRAAQLNLRKQKRSPYYWAGFVLQGEWK